MSNIDTVVFDKTGTLTKGSFEVTSIVPAGAITGKNFEFAALAESGSNHPIAVSILNALESRLRGKWLMITVKYRIWCKSQG